MEQQTKTFWVFLASPSDLNAERTAIREIVRQVDLVCSRVCGCRVELLAWEDAPPGAGRPQDLINTYVDKADLLVGFLWKTMGSDCGINNRTGFEEEFSRSLERRQKSGAPEIWLFFKKVEGEIRGPLDDKLQRVLAFRAELERNKSIMYKDFSDVTQLRDLVHNQLLVHVINRAKPSPQTDEKGAGGAPSQSQIPAGEATSASPNLERRTRSVAPLVGLLKETIARLEDGKLLAFGRLEQFGPARTARLILFAASTYNWHAQHIVLGTHETNSVYLCRQDLALTDHERMLILRTIISDQTLNKPGWFWLQTWRETKLGTVLAYLASVDGDDWMRQKAIAFARRIAFPLRKFGGKGNLISRILRDSNTEVRLEGLRYLAIRGAVSDLPAIERLLADENRAVRTEAERTARNVRLRIAPDQELRDLIQAGDPLTDEDISSIAPFLNSASHQTLELALTHPYPGFRAACSRELCNRRTVDKTTANRMIEDDDLSVKQCGYTTLARLGEELNIAEVRRGLKYDDFSLALLSSRSATIEPVIEAMLEKLSFEHLWARVEAFDDQSNLALKVSSHIFPDETASAARRILSDDLQSLTIRAATRQEHEKPTVPSAIIWPLLQPEERAVNVAKDLRLAALEHLAKYPIKLDRDTFLKYLESNPGSQQEVACLKGLEKIGRTEDAEKVIPFLRSGRNATAAAAARTYLVLKNNPVLAAKAILDEIKPLRVTAVIAFGLEGHKKEVWAALEPLMQHHDEDIRRLVCYYAVQTMTRSTLEALLKRYLQLGTYYYNVVTLLDRAAYFPSRYLLGLLEEERVFFQETAARAETNQYLSSYSAWIR